MQKNSVIFPFLISGLFFSLVPVLSGADDISYDSGRRRDPFIPLKAEDGAFVNSSSAGIKLEGIIYDPGRRSMAVLSGKTYQEGESVGEAKVLSIQKDQVVISLAGEEKILRIREAEKN